MDSAIPPWLEGNTPHPSPLPLRGEGALANRDSLAEALLLNRLSPKGERAAAGRVRGGWMAHPATALAGSPLTPALSP